MSGYARTTRECPINQVHPGLYQIVREYFQKHQLGDPVTETRLCCETVAEKKEPAGLGVLLDPLLNEGSDSNFHLAMLLTADWLIWARSGDRSEHNRHRGQAEIHPSQSVRIQADEIHGVGSHRIYQ